MKRNLMLLLVSALLVYSLTACGCASKDAGTVQNGNAATEDTQTGTNNDTNANGGVIGNGTDGANTGDGNTPGTAGNGSNGDSIIEDAGDAIQNGVNDVTDAITGNNTTTPANDGVAIDDMLQNDTARSRTTR